MPVVHHPAPPAPREGLARAPEDLARTLEGLERTLEDLERELKFVLPAGRAAAARAWLASLCRPDPEFPGARVWTVYYDTANVASLGEKLNSDYLKMKLRVRWYGSAGGAVAGPAFVEAKFRVGARREKVRVRLGADAASVSGWRLDDPRFAALPRALAPLGVAAGPAWRPVLKLRYDRSRFIERATGARVSLDEAITPDAVNPRALALLNPAPLQVAVIEVKGPGDALPRALVPLLQLGARQGSLSKYAAVYQHARRLF